MTIDLPVASQPRVEYPTALEGDVLRKRIAVIRKAWSGGAAAVGLPLSGLSGISVVQNFISLRPQSIVGHVTAAWNKAVVGPIDFAFSLIGIELSAFACSAIASYVVFGTTTVFTLFRIYDPRRGTMVVKGIWGGLTKHLFAGRNLANPWPRRFYVVLATILWPVIAIEYSSYYRRVWLRYADDSGRPGPEIGTFTSNARTVSELLPDDRWCGYNSQFDHNLTSDSWYALKGNVITLFAANLLAATAVAAVLLGLAYLS
ncbi:MAG: hypothetical protein KDE15_02000 [Erythrobacter sp.]|nr:hypothetical protein [Erythrobacter sp.]